jgi:FMN phosphatase YigB (HAD superfamily)
MIKGIIFDFHGTLAHKVKSSDSLKECEFLRSLGLDIYYQEWEAASKFVFFIEYPKGNIDSSEDFTKAVLHTLGLRATNEIISKIVDYFKANNQYEAYPDMESIRNLNVKKAILTTIPRFVFDNLDLAEFDPIMTGKEIGRAKPHPCGFLKILSKWNLEPNEVLMVGNDVDCDILPAMELGLKTAFIDREGKVAGEADYIISSLEAIQEIIKTI